jgi:NADH-quinone oxidoreductase subunit H
VPEQLNQPWWIDLIKAFLIINLVLGSFAYLTWVERKLLGRMQNRYGPNRAGPFGLLQPIADLVKLLRKESFFPASAVDVLYITARSRRSASSPSAGSGTWVTTTSPAGW